MSIKGVDAAVLGVEDLSAGRNFYTDFGLTEGEHGATGADFVTLDGTEVLLRGVDDVALPSPVAGGSTIREVVWGVGSDADLEEIAAELARDRPVARDADRTVHSVDDDGFGIAFRRERRVAGAAPSSKANIYGAPPVRPINSRVDFLQAIRPTSVAHVVLFSTDVPRAERFYVERLQFRVSDRFRNGKGVFLRSAGSPYHHNLFLIQGEKRGLHHIAFPVHDFHDVILGGQKLLDKGWNPKVGPGRHVIGSNYFWYFNSPLGGAMELTADMDCADDLWEAREWDFVPQNTMAWSTSFNLPSAPAGR